MTKTFGVGNNGTKEISRTEESRLDILDNILGTVFPASASNTTVVASGEAIDINRNPGIKTYHSKNTFEA
jgi:hypothetical protein